MLSKTIAKYIQSLNYKKARDEESVFIAEGPKVILEFLTSANIFCKSLFALPDWFAENENVLRNISADKKIEINEIELGKISQLQTPNKVLGIFYKKNIEEIILQNNISLILDDIRDPGNFGTIIRTADWFGIKNIICSNECVDYYNPKVVQASMGSLARVNVIYKDLMEFINENKKVKIYAATLTGKDISEFKKMSEGIILIGNESKGIENNLLNAADEQITISKKGAAESLNAAVACGIILSHFC